MRRRRRVMQANVDDISRDLAALTQRFIDLGARLGEAARGLEDNGAPPPTALVEDLAGARGQFAELRTQALTAAHAAGVPAPAEPESLNDIEPLLAAIAEALRARVRREALQHAQTGALTILDRVLVMVHRDDANFAAVIATHARAQEVREAVLGLTEPDSDEAQRVFASVQPFFELLTMVESREAVDDERYAQLEEAVTQSLGRPLAVAAARGRLSFVGEFEPEPSPAPVCEPLANALEESVAAAEPELAAPPVVADAPGEPAATTPALTSAALDGPATTAPPPAESDVVPAAAPEPVAPVPSLEMPGLDAAPVTTTSASPAAAGAAATTPAEASVPDETAQWWLAAWARWSGWKASQAFADAAREELRKYPYLLSVPIQKSPEYEDGLLAYGYSILIAHVEKQNPGCIGHALNSLRSGHARPVGDQLYEYLVTEGRLRETYAEFVKDALMAAVPDPGVWFQFRILESREDTRILQRPSSRLGDSELSGQRLASDNQRYAEHKFRMTLGPLTARFVLVSTDLREARSAGFKLVVDGQPSDAGWAVAVVTGPRPRAEARRLAEEGIHVTGLGREFGAVWVALFNADPAADRRYELSIFLRKDTRSPFRVKA